MIIKRIRNCQKGMTYVELIVVLGIFSVLSAVSIYNYGAFQAKVDIKNLASDIALQIVEAQKSSVNGLLPATYAADWKPSYGLFFYTNPIDPTDKNSFIYFTDADSSGFYNINDGKDADCRTECIKKTFVKKNNSISSLDIFCTGLSIPVSDLTITFSRLSSGARISSTDSYFNSCDNISYAQIGIASPDGASSVIKVYPSGMVQIN
jgi:prepilin-type N-terminal cleavage/methylation domain-containing protein